MDVQGKDLASKIALSTRKVEITVDRKPSKAEDIESGAFSSSLQFDAAITYLKTKEGELKVENPIRDYKTAVAFAKAIAVSVRDNPDDDIVPNNLSAARNFQLLENDDGIT